MTLAVARSADAPRWLAVCRHRVRGFLGPYLLVLQHHLVESQARIAAPVVPAGTSRAMLLTPRLDVEGGPHKAMLLDLNLGAAEPAGSDR